MFLGRTLSFNLILFWLCISYSIILDTTYTTHELMHNHDSIAPRLPSLFLKEGEMHLSVNLFGDPCIIQRVWKWSSNNMAFQVRDSLHTFNAEHGHIRYSLLSFIIYLV